MRAAAAAQAVVFNAGNANACNGAQGLDDAAGDDARWPAAPLGIAPELVLVASTGIIGVPAADGPQSAPGLPRVEVRPDGGHDAAHAIMTTDTRAKECRGRARDRRPRGAHRRDDQGRRA